MGGRYTKQTQLYKHISDRLVAVGELPVSVVEGNCFQIILSNVEFHSNLSCVFSGESVVKPCLDEGWCTLQPLKVEDHKSVDILG